MTARVGEEIILHCEYFLCFCESPWQSWAQQPWHKGPLLESEIMLTCESAWEITKCSRLWLCKSVLPECKSGTIQQSQSSLCCSIQIHAIMLLFLTVALMEMLRTVLDPRKNQQVHMSLDLIQVLIAHKHIQDPVSSLSLRRDPGKTAGHCKPTEDDDDWNSVAGWRDSSSGSQNHYVHSCLISAQLCNTDFVWMTTYLWCVLLVWNVLKRNVYLVLVCNAHVVLNVMQILH